MQGVQQGWRGLYSCWRDEVRPEPGDLNVVVIEDLDFDDQLQGVLYGGGWGDVGRGRQKRRRSYQLFRVQMYDGSKSYSSVAAAILWANLQKLIPRF